MRVVCIGGGPGGLYAAILLKKSHPTWQIAVYERNRPDDTYGWGVVLSDQTLQALTAADPETGEAIRRAFYHWDDIEVHFKGRTLRSGGHGFSGIGRMRLLLLLRDRAHELGVALHFETEATLQHFADADLIIAADGANSRVRNVYAEHFQPTLITRKCRYIWLGTHHPFDAFTFAFKETEWGWFQMHAYRFEDETSTVIVETPEENWLAAGIDKMTPAESVALCEHLFGEYLGGLPLLNNASHMTNPWLNFKHVVNEHWYHDNILLLGDAAHTAHFSIGSGTKLAMEDAITLDRVLREHTDPQTALAEYEAVRKIEVIKIQSAARNSTEWFENVDRYTAFEAEQFAYSLLTRSQRVSHENLRLRDAEWLESYEQWFAQRSGLPTPNPVPPMFTPFTLRGLTLKNRIVVSPMAMYSADDGTVGDFHFVFFGARAHGGAGLIFTEMTCPAPDARISPGCAGMYQPEHKAAWQRIVNYVHRHSSAKIALQLGHAGPKGSTRLGWEGNDVPLPDGNWPLIAASAIPYSPQNQTPRAATRADMDAIKADFVRATEWAIEIGFDWLELHCAHGYLFASFLSPATNHRTDAYGGSLENRVRFPLEVFSAMRAVWPANKPMSVRISAHDWLPDGNTPEDAVEIARLFKAAGVDLIDVSSGQTTPDSKPIYGRMYQTPFADKIRNQLGIATMAVGNIYEPDHVNSIIASGRADLCALARPHLADPHWTLHAAAEIGYQNIEWPNQFLTAKRQLERIEERKGQMLEL